MPDPIAERVRGLIRLAAGVGLYSLRVPALRRLDTTRNRQAAGRYSRACRLVAQLDTLIDKMPETGATSAALVDHRVRARQALAQWRDTYLPPLQRRPGPTFVIDPRLDQRSDGAGGTTGPVRRRKQWLLWAAEAVDLLVTHRHWTPTVASRHVAVFLVHEWQSHQATDDELRQLLLVTWKKAERHRPTARTLADDYLQDRVRKAYDRWKKAH